MSNHHCPSVASQQPQPDHPGINNHLIHLEVALPPHQKRQPQGTQGRGLGWRRDDKPPSPTPDTVDEGANPGDAISFTINGIPATPVPITLNGTPVPPSTPVTWTSFSDRWEVDLGVPDSDGDGIYDGSGAIGTLAGDDGDGLPCCPHGCAGEERQGLSDVLR
jgi:hypothetical protein